MKTLLYIGMLFHEKTESTGFLLDLLERTYRVTRVLLDAYAENPYAELNAAAGDYDVLVCFQILPPRQMLNRYFSYRHAAFFPMLDGGCPRASKPEKWYVYRDFQIICFSSTLGKQLTNAGFSVRCIRFFPKPADTLEFGDEHSVFLWARRESINCRLVETLLSGADIHTVHVHRSPDPGERFIPPPESSPVQYRYSDWFPQKEDMLKEMGRSAFYVAPRMKEGIGMSFLEAMAMGRCVVAHDHATMNEYITHGKTGFLFDLRNPKPLRIGDVRAIQRQAYRFAVAGYEAWEAQKYKICEWLVEPARLSTSRLVWSMTTRFFRNPWNTVKILWMDRRVMAGRRREGITDRLEGGRPLPPSGVEDRA